MLKAARFAHACHQLQFRDYNLAGTSIRIPYINHVIRVAGMASTILLDSDEDDICAAWCHDEIEDCGVTYDELVVLFGKTVADLTMGLTSYTKRPENIQACKSLSRADRIRLNNRGVAEQSLRVRRIKICDRIDNLTDTLLYSEAPRALRYADETEQLLKVAFGDMEKSLYYQLWTLIDEIRKKYK